MLAVVYGILFLVTHVASANECSKSEDCDMEGAECISGTCVCPARFIANSLNTKCLPVIQGYGSSCEDNVQCSQSLKGGGICSSNVCICTKGYHYFRGECWKTAGLGETCKHNENCFVSNDFEASVCSENKTCACSPNYYQREYSSCRRESYSPGDACGIYLDCKFENAVCTLNRTCEIGSNSVGNLITTSCDRAYNKMEANAAKLQLSKVGDQCKSNSDCPENAECNEIHKCSCLKGYYTHDNNSCSPELGGKCKSDSDCLGKNTECRNGTVCVCKQGYVTSYNGQYCDKMSRDIGWSCLRDEQCGLFGPNSICLKKKCQCNEKSHFIKEDLFCWVKKSIEESCISDKDCGGETSVKCVANKCQCVNGTHPSSDRSTCRHDSTSVDEPCVENLDCIFNNSICDNSTNKCICLRGYINRDGVCIPGVSAQCRESSDCKANGSSCIEGKCACKSGYTASYDFSNCLPIVDNLINPCSESSQCSKIEGVCVNSHCKCLPGSHFVDDWQCFVTKMINQPCTSFGNCTSVKNSYCFKGTCKCKPGYHLMQNGTLCSGVSKRFDAFSSISILTLSYLFKKILF